MNRAWKRALKREGLSEEEIAKMVTMRSEPPMPSSKVTLGYCHPGEVSASFMMSVYRANQYEMRRTGSSFGILEKGASTGNVGYVRNQIVTQFLNSDAEYLWFVDADMGFPEWALHRMLGAADPTERPIIAALAFSLSKVGEQNENFAEVFELFPVIGRWNRNDAGEIIGYLYADEYPDDRVCRVDTTGAACVLIHRSALEKIGKDWFAHLPLPDDVPGQQMVRTVFGEDVSFYIRCTENDIPVWLDTMVKTSHHKGGIYLTHELYQQQQAIKAAKEAVRAEVPA